MATRPLPPADLAQVLEHTAPLWSDLKKARFFITGGTGFFGAWLLESLIAANREFDLEATALVLTREPETFRERMPHIVGSKEISLLKGDIRNFQFPEVSFTHVIHAATQASVKLNHESPELMRDTIVKGTRRALDLALHCRAQRFLLTSSGAVYGPQPAWIRNIGEDHPFLPIDPPSAYALGKREAERICSEQTGIECAIARGFAFAGPHLPLDGAYAIGNFVRDGLAGSPIAVSGDGTALRSYLYGSDLAIWLWTLLVRAKAGRPYNVGSPHGVSIAVLAERVGHHFGVQTKIQGKPTPGVPPHSYVPDIERAKTELGLFPRVSLSESISKMAAWGLGTI